MSVAGIRTKKLVLDRRRCFMGSTLRDRMIGQMRLRNLSKKTEEAYVWAVLGMAKFYHCSPDRLTDEQVQKYLLYLHDERKLAWSSCNIVYSALRFLYDSVLHRPDITFSIPPRRFEKHLPLLLGGEEVKRILDAPRSLKHRVLLMTVYGTGLRVGEAVYLRPHHIESSRKMVRVEQGKGNKDRYTLLPERLIKELRSYWRMFRPKEWLFFGRDRSRPMPVRTAQQIYYNAKKIAGITKGRGIHTLRHCFATHLLDAGYDIFTIKRMMGHGSLSTTARYLHMTRARMEAIQSPLDTLDPA